MAYSNYYYSRRRSPVRKTNTTKSPLNRHIKRGFVLFIIVSIIGVTINISSSHTHTNASVEVVKRYSKTQTACIDAGHGGADPGAITTDGAISEQDINLIVAKQVEANLESKGYQVFMTRTNNDQSLTNNDRYTYCNAQNATILVSIHHNFFQDPTVDYASALFYKDSDQALANSILESVATKLALQNNDISQFEDGVLSKSTMPAALSEGFFITSYAEYNKLTTSGSTRLSDEAAAITEGIINYFTQPATSKPVINTNPQQIERNDE